MSSQSSLDNATAFKVKLYAYWLAEWVVVLSVEMRWSCAPMNLRTAHIIPGGAWAPGGRGQREGAVTGCACTGGVLIRLAL